ncbi:MAG: hypothetical protein KJT03_22700, partial [Verrucomicrobiae bacterium]|nr:hypothetical protein [Verrucomicrobiae bacterium]
LLLWEDTLLPMEITDDRGLKSASVALPDNSKGSIQFFTNQGPNKGGDWDWSVFGNFKFLDTAK